jgi:hypothetical protein
MISDKFSCLFLMMYPGSCCVSPYVEEAGLCGCPVSARMEGGQLLGLTYDQSVPGVPGPRSGSANRIWIQEDKNDIEK